MVAPRGAIAYETPVNNADMVGGVPVISVMGTPRAIGEGLGQRLKPRLQVLGQYLAEQIAANARISGSGRPLTPQDIRERVRSQMPPLADLEPGLAMEFESISRTAGIPLEDLLIVHGYTDLLSAYSCQGPGIHSTFIAFTAEQTASGAAAMALVWEADPALLPYVTIVHRIPAHGPANLSLTIAGLHPMAFLSEARLAVASNTMIVSDGEPGYFTTHIVGSLATAPSFDDAVSRAQAGPRWGGRAIHIMDAEGQRCSLETSGRKLVRLPDQIKSAPRVHTNLPIDESVRALSTSDAMARMRLEQIASLAVRAREVGPETVLDWFGLGQPPATPGAETTSRRRRGTVPNPDSCIALWLDPRARDMRVRRGQTGGFDQAKL